MSDTTSSASGASSSASTLTSNSANTQSNQDTNQNDQKKTDDNRKPPWRRNYNNNNNNKPWNRNNQSKPQKPPASTFKGAISDMNGHVFECHGEAYSAAQFHRTMEELQTYCSQKYKYGEDISTLVRLLEDVDMKKYLPADPPANASRSEEEVWKTEISDFVKRKSQFQQNKSALFSVVWAQCSEAMKAKLRSLDEFSNWEKSRNCLLLLKAVKSISYKFETQGKYVHSSLFLAIAAFYQFRQQANQSNSDYLIKFKALYTIIHHYGGSIGTDPLLVRAELKRERVLNSQSLLPGNPSYDSRVSKAQERFLGYAFLHASCHRRYSELVKDLENNYSRGSDQYPANLTSAYNMLINFKSNKSDTKGNRYNEEKKDVGEFCFSNTDVLLNNRGDPVVCYKCKGNHYANDEKFHPKVAETKLDNKSSNYLSSSVSKPSTSSSHSASSVTSSSSLTSPDNTNKAVSFLLQQADTDESLDADMDYGFCYTNIHHSLNLHTSSKHGALHPRYILLDTGSTFNVFNNPDFLTNIRHSSKMRGYANGGHQDSSMKGTLPGFGEVWFNPASLVNILSLAEVADKFKLSYDHTSQSFIVHRPDESQLAFRRINGGRLYLHDATTTSSNYLFLQTVEENKSLYSSAQIKRAANARRLYIAAGRPGHRMFKFMLFHHLFVNTDVTTRDADIAFDIYGADVGKLKGATVRKKPTRISVPHVTPLPNDILAKHRDVTLATDFFYVDGILFLLSTSRIFQFMTVQHCNSTDGNTMLAGILRFITLYTARGFNIPWLLADKQFACIADDLHFKTRTRLNCTSANEHVGDIERAIRLVKERIRSFLTTFPFRYIPRVIKLELVNLVVFTTNHIVRKNSISPYLSPCRIVLGQAFDASKSCRLAIGSYCQIHEEELPRNSASIPRTVDAIALRAINNLQGSYLFLRLDTWRRVDRRSWTELPMPQHIIDAIEAKALSEATPAQQKKAFTFRRRNRSVITSLQSIDSHLLADLRPLDEGAETSDDNDDIDINQDDTGSQATSSSGSSSNDPPSSPSTSASPDDHDISFDNTTVNNPSSDINIDNEDDISYESNTSSDGPTTDSRSADDASRSADDATSTLDAVVADISTDSTNGDGTSSSDEDENEFLRFAVNPEISDSNLIEMEPDEERPGTTRYNLRKRNPPHGHNFHSTNIDPISPTISPYNFNGRYGFAMTQMTAREGLRRFGERAAEALVKEWVQLNDKGVFEGVRFDDVTPEQRSKALRLVQLIKEKRCGKIKGRTCADGRKQRNFINPDEATSPTVSTEALLLTLMIDAHEHRDVATCDITGAFLQSEMDEYTLVVVDGALVDMLLRANKDFAKFVHIGKNGKKVVYLQLKKALYGTLRAARLFWENLTDKLTKKGFILNPYDNCVANKIINGHQCTVTWHVDDLKISHKDPAVVSEIIAYLESIFGEMTVMRGKSHTYVGMDIFFPGDGSVKINMKTYLNDAINAFPDELTGKATTPAAEHIFQTDDKSPKLPESKRELLHSIVAKLLFVSTRGRPDIHLPISFLTSRVSKADKDDWKKLSRLLTYIKSTIDLDLTLSAKSTSVVKWWCDAAYAVRDDFKSQTGSTMSMGRGTIMNKSGKQKLNTKSSTEAELVGASDTVPQMIWTNYFLESQGFIIEHATLYQDNKSAMLMEQNGKFSSGKQTKHVNIRYFFIKDRIASGEIEIEHCPTDEMVADYLTKPLQGSKFVMFRDMILGITPIDFNDDS
jgi:hypothetical protein